MPTIRELFSLSFRLVPTTIVFIILLMVSSPIGWVLKQMLSFNSFLFAPRIPYIQPERRIFYCVRVLGIITSFIVVSLAKPNRCLLKTPAIFLRVLSQIFRQYNAIETFPIWLALVGFFFFFFFQPIRNIFNSLSCYKFALVLRENCTPFSANRVFLYIREFKIEERGRRRARPEVRITIWSSLRMTKMSTLARVGALLLFTDEIQRCSVLLVKRQYFDGLYCGSYISVSTVRVFLESVRVFC